MAHTEQDNPQLIPLQTQEALVASEEDPEAVEVELSSSIFTFYFLKQTQNLKTGTHHQELMKKTSEYELRIIIFKKNK